MFSLGQRLTRYYLERRMKKYFVIITGAFLSLLSIGALLAPMAVEARTYRTRTSDVRVGGYYRSNGSYIQPYYRSKADSSRLNNYVCFDYARCR